MTAPLQVGVKAALNRLTLCFLDREVERDFRRQRAEASRPVLRRFLVFMVLLVVVLTTVLRQKLDVARSAGMPVPPQFELGGAGLIFAASFAALLFVGTLSRRFVPYLHTLTALCMAGLVLEDNWHAMQLPLPYALNGTLLNLVVVYIASQLRFATASALGIGSSVSYFFCMFARNAPFLEGNPVLQLQLGVAMTVLTGANLLLMFVTHQRELAARLAYHRARLLEQRGVELESALSSLKQAELQLVETEKQAAVGHLVAGILHEMNSPLGALSSATPTLERGRERLRSSLGTGARPESVSPELAVMLAASERLVCVQAESGQRIRDVVESLRQFVALDRAMLQVADVRSGLETAVALIRPSLPSGVKLVLDVPECPIWVQCFPARLNQVFSNLLKNAVAAFDAPGLGAGDTAEIVVSAQAESDSVQIVIRDTGRGIAAERLRQIFELDLSRQGSRVKLSLGLPASRSVVEAIGGKLGIESEVGQGTRAKIELPLRTTPSGARSEPVHPRPAADAPLAPAPSAASDAVGFLARVAGQR
jgi:signal transduction histidine kinase